MKYFKLILLLIPIQIIQAQPAKGLFWGGSINADMIIEQTNVNYHFELLPPPNIYFHLGNVFNEYFRVDLYAGYTAWSGNWNGFDLGAALKSEIYDRTYITLCFSYNPIYGGSGEGMQAPIYYKKTFTYSGIGAGYYITRIAYVQLNYLLPLNLDKTYSISYDGKTTSQLISKLKLDFGWNFSL